MAESTSCALYGMMAVFGAKIGAGVPGPGLLSTLPSGLVILRPVPPPTIIRAFLIPVRLSPSAREQIPDYPSARERIRQRAIQPE
jgi:hypothetical protein